MAVIRSAEFVDETAPDVVAISVLSLLGFVVVIAATIIGCACCGGGNEPKKDNPTGAEKTEGQDDKKKGDKEDEKDAKDAKDSKDPTKKDAPTKKDEKTKLQSVKPEPKGADGGKSMAKGKTTKAGGDEQSKKPGAGAPSMKPEACGGGFEIPAFTVGGEDKADFADTMVDLEGRQEFKATYVKQSTRDGGGGGGVMAVGFGKAPRKGGKGKDKEPTKECKIVAKKVSAAKTQMPGTVMMATSKEASKLDGGIEPPPRVAVPATVMDKSSPSTPTAETKKGPSQSVLRPSPGKRAAAGSVFA